MEATRIIVLGLVIPILVMLLALKGSRKKRLSQLPPRSMGWPLIGDALYLLKRQPMGTLGDYMEGRISRYGKIFTTKFFGKLVIVSGDSELNHFVLQNQTKLFDRLLPPRYLIKLIGESVAAEMTADALKYQRSIFIRFFASTTRLKDPILCEAQQLATMALSSWENNSIINANDEIMKFTFNLLAKETMSMAPGEPKTEMLRRELADFIKGVFSIPLKFPGTAYWNSLQSRDNIIEAINQIIEERMRKSTTVTGDEKIKEEEEDLLTWLMNNTCYPREQIIDHVRLTFLVGYHEASRTLALLIYLLGGCPKAVEQLRDEYYGIIRNKEKREESKLTWEDFKSMEFTHCVINETLRLGSTGRILEKATTDVQYKGYIIPRGCIVLVHLPATHLDPSLYEDPQNFNPWRWMGESSPNKSNFMPFGRGLRQCPGSELVRLEMIVFLHHIILKYNWKLASPKYTIKDLADKGLPIEIQAL